MSTQSTRPRSILDSTPRLAWYGGWVSILVGMLHSLARFATADGQEDVTALTRLWAEPARSVLEPLLTFTDPQHVYVIYGMLWGPFFLAALGCAVVVRRTRPAAGIGGGERWAWRIYLAGLSLFTLGGFGSYFGSWIDPALIDLAFMVLVIPGVLTMLVGGTWLGIALLRRRFRPLVTAVLLALIVPSVFAVSSLMSLGSAFIPMLLAWGFAGRSLAAAGAPARAIEADAAQLTSPTA